jgi:predicted MPP superfamily phosphohydrolase
MKIQVLSDIHLEFYRHFPKIPVYAKYLFLAGDIGRIDKENFKLFFDNLTKDWSKIFYVLGNHEFYVDGKNIFQLTQDYTQFFKQYQNIHLLDRNKIILDDYEVLGCTLWSKPIEYNKCLNDFNCILNENNLPISLEDFHEMHNRDLKWLVDNYNSDKKTIIMTHFPLISEGVGLEKYKNQPESISTYFTNNISLKNKEQLVCISGHTHFSHDFFKEDIRYISNQMGYPDQSGKCMMLKDETFEI